MKKSIARAAALSVCLFTIAFLMDGCGSPASSSSKTSSDAQTAQSSVDSGAAVSQAAASSVYGNTNGNITNRGQAVQLDGWIYYGNNGITKMSADGSQTTKINSDCYAEYLNAADGWIYFVDAKYNWLYKIRTDGSEKTLLCTGKISVVHLVDNWIYYLQGDSGTDVPCKMHTDGTGEMQTPTDYCSFADGWIYYASSEKVLNKVRTDGTDMTVIGTDRLNKGPVADGGWIYYPSDADGLLYRIKPDGTGRQALTSEEIAIFNVEGDWVYYTVNDDFRLYKIGTDGTGKTRLTDNTVANINIAGDWIFYESISGSSLNLYKMHMNGTGQQLLEQN